MSLLNKIDKAAEAKGAVVVKIWQFIKFIVVSLGAMIVQFTLLNTLNLIPPIAELYNQEFIWNFFVYPVAIGGLGYFIVSNVANIVAQIVAFFINKEKTFNSSANVAVTLPIYIVFTIALIVFAAWLNPTIKEALIGWEWFAGLFEDASAMENAAKNIATMACSAMQFFLYFPVDMILFHKKKEDK